MSRDRRSEHQLAFDGAKHGWSFCNAAMLKGKVLRCEDVAKKLHPDDTRHQELEVLRSTLKKLTEKP